MFAYPRFENKARAPSAELEGWLGIEVEYGSGHPPRFIVLPSEGEI